MGEGLLFYSQEKFYVSPNIKEVKKYRAKGNFIPIYKEIVSDLETPVSVFLNFAKTKIIIFFGKRCRCREISEV